MESIPCHVYLFFLLWILSFSQTVYISFPLGIHRSFMNQSLYLCHQVITQYLSISCDLCDCYIIGTVHHVGKLRDRKVKWQDRKVTCCLARIRRLQGMWLLSLGGTRTTVTCSAAPGLQRPCSDLHSIKSDTPYLHRVIVLLLRSLRSERPE